jgi:hypothetical protein
MILDFPASPSVGDKYPASPVANIPTYTWDGEKWVAAIGTFSDLQTWMRLTGNQNISGGFSVTPANLGNVSANFTCNPLLGNYQMLTNAGAFTITAPSVACAIDYFVVNSATAGAITFSGFRVGSVGDTLNTTSGNWFIITVLSCGAVATYGIKALQ